MKFSFFLLFVFYAVSWLQAQEEKKIEILNANTIEYNKHIANGAQRLLGDVRFMHNQVVMYCDSAYYYPENDSLHAFGHIHISQGDTLHLYGEFLRYDGNSSLAQVRKNVKLIDRETTLTTDNMDYDIRNKVGYYFKGGEIINGENKLKSEQGYYYSTMKIFHFKGKVFCTNARDTILSDTLQYNTVSRVAYFFGPSHIYTQGSYLYCEDGWYNTAKDLSRFSKNAFLRSKSRTLSGDTLYYDGGKGKGKALRHVMIRDSVQKVILKGHFGYYLRDTEYSFITDSALMIQYSEKDSLYLHADTIISTLDSAGKKMLKAYHHVCFYRNDLQGRCDSAVYTERDSTLRLFRIPVLWSDVHQLTGEYIELLMKNGQMYEARLYNFPMIISEEDSLKYNQVKGKQMIGYFRNNQLYKILVKGNGQTLYYPEDKGEVIGLNKTDCSDLLIHIDSSKITRIDFLTRPEATLFPLNQLPEERFLKGFVWYKQWRPLSLYDIFIPRNLNAKKEEKE